MAIARGKDAAIALQHDVRIQVSHSAARRLTRGRLGRPPCFRREPRRFRRGAA